MQAGLVLYYIYSAGFGSASEQYHLGLYLLLTFALVGIVYRCRKSSPAARPSVLDFLLIVGSIFTIGYWMIEYPNLANRAGNYNPLDIFVGAIAIVISFEVSRRDRRLGTPYHCGGRYPLRALWESHAGRYRAQRL